MAKTRKKAPPSAAEAKKLLREDNDARKKRALRAELGKLPELPEKARTITTVNIPLSLVEKLRVVASHRKCTVSTLLREGAELVVSKYAA